MEKLVLTSPAFLSGDWISVDYTARGKDQSPQLNLEGICVYGNAYRKIPESQN